MGEAREAYATSMIKKTMGVYPEYAQDLQFDVSHDKRRNPNESIITDALKQEVKEQIGGAGGEGE